MKFIYCTCNTSMKNRLVETLEANGVHAYQIIDEVAAKPLHGNPRLNNAVWPGYNTIINMQISDNNKAASVMDILRHFNKTATTDAERITACSLPVDGSV
ncbi:MAG: hypothetical protein U9Q98_03755 [Bacteroidota bacterium]|nr:hypothetical protein [Bacteroidota bacterium]